MKKFSYAIITIIATSLLFFGVAAAADDYKTKQDKTTSSGTMTKDQTTTSSMQSQEQFMRASKIMDKSVKNDQDKDLGKVNELLFSKDGELKYIVFSKGGALGVGGDLIPVPFEAVKDSFQMQEDNIIISGWSEDRLNNAPTVSEDELASLEQESGQVYDRVHAYFGEGASSGQPQTGTMTPQDPSSQPKSSDPSTGTSDPIQPKQQ